MCFTVSVKTENIENIGRMYGEIFRSELEINFQIERNLPVNTLFVDRNNVPANVDLSKLPENVSETLRLVTVGDYDICACIGEHVKNTSEIGQFKIISSDYIEGKLRIRFKLENCTYTD